MISIKIIGLSLLIVSVSIADEITFYDGRTIKNCIVTPLGRQVKIVTNEKMIHSNQSSTFIQNQYYFAIDEVYRIVYVAIDPTQETQTEHGNEIPITAEQQIPNRNIPAIAPEYHFPNMKLLPVSIISFGIAWDYLAQASDNQTLNNEYVSTQKDRKRVIGISLIVVGVINTIIAFERVELKVNKNSVGLSYNF